MEITIEQAFTSLEGAAMVMNEPLAGKISYKVYSLIEELNRVLKPANLLLEPHRYLVGSVDENTAKEKEAAYSKIYNEIKNQVEEIKDISFQVSDFETANVPIAFWAFMKPFIVENPA